MPSKPPIVFPNEQRVLAQMGERIRLARKRRKLSSEVVAARSRMSRTTLYKVEAGDASVTMGSYLRVFSVLGLEGDFEKLALDDHVGRKLQDLALGESPASKRSGKKASASSTRAKTASE